MDKASIRTISGISVEQLARRKRITSTLLPFAGLAAILVIFGAGTKGGLFTPSNFSNLIDQVFTTMLVSVGAVFIYAHGGMDMSLGAVSGVTQMLAAMAIVGSGCTVSPILIILLCVLVSCVLCAVSGIVHVVMRVPIFVVTLCMNFACLGILTTVTTNGNITIDYRFLQDYNRTGARFGILFVVTTICYILFEKTKIGKIQKAIGGSPVVVQQSGIDPGKFIIISHIIAGACLGLASFFQLARQCKVGGSTGGNIQLNVMIALVLGGMPLSGGTSSRLLSALIGAFTVTVLTNGMTLMGIDVGITNGVKGLLFVVVVALSYARPVENMNQ